MEWGFGCNLALAHKFSENRLKGAFRWKVFDDLVSQCSIVYGQGWLCLVSCGVANTEDAAEGSYEVRRRWWLVLCSHSSDSGHSPPHRRQLPAECCEADVTRAAFKIGFTRRLNKEE